MKPIADMTNEELAQTASILQQSADSRNAKLKAYAQNHPEKYEKKFKKHPPINEQFSALQNAINQEMSKRK